MRASARSLGAEAPTTNLCLHFRFDTNFDESEVSAGVSTLRIPIEHMKPEGGRGTYLHPDLYDEGAQP